MDTVSTRNIAESLGFPSGYFSIRSLATGKLWDIHGNFDADGTLVYLWREKEKSLVENLRDPRADNQIFYIDETGTLCSKYSGHAIDVEDGRLVLRRRRPMTFPYPNAYSHPIPRFAYDSSSGHIHVRFNCDPAYPPPPPSSPSHASQLSPNNPKPTTTSSTTTATTASTAWRERQYLVASVPLRKPPSALEAVGNFFSSAAATIIPPPSTPNPTYSNDELDPFSLREDEVMEEERGAEGDVDDSYEVKRDIRVLSLPLATREGGTHGGGTRAARERRRWEILPITKEKATFRSPARS